MTKSKVLLGMSGGVDSSVAAAVLLEQGYDVVGVTLKLWDRDECADVSNKMCCSINDVEDARSVAAKLGIPHYVLNFKNFFKEQVVDYFIKDYLIGRTPNPCIACNRFIKFSEMLKKAEVLECNYVATGHYARIELDTQKGLYQLKKGHDYKKDQSYVLYHLNQETLPKVLLPLWNMSKDEVRKKASDIGIRVANKPDSQEICFVDKDYSEFIKLHCDEKIIPGNFLDTTGKIIGNHKGIIHYTVGQRKGLGAFGERVFVKTVNPHDNTVVLGTNEDLFSKRLLVEDITLTSVNTVPHELKVQSKIRYSAPCKESTIKFTDNNEAIIEFEEAQRAITPGQSVVFYQDDLVIGGGIIKATLD